MARLADDHPKADEEEIRLVVRRSLELKGKHPWRLALAERLMESFDEPSRWLLEEAAKQLEHEYGRKVSTRWRREYQRDQRRETQIEHDREMIDRLAKELKAKNIPGQPDRGKKEVGGNAGHQR